MASVDASDAQVKLWQFVKAVVAAGRAAGVAQKQQMLQQFIDAVAAQALGRPRGAPKSGVPENQLSPWRCSACGSQRQRDFSYCGSYHRTVVFGDGDAGVQIPRVRCRCGGNVRPDFGHALPKRKRHWYDMDAKVVQWYVEGVSYRGVARCLRHDGVQVGLGSLPAKVAAFAGVDIHATVSGGPAQAMTMDGGFWRLGAGSRAQLYVHQVLPRDEPLVRNGKPVAWHRTGKVLACQLADEETQDAWNAALAQVVSAGLVDDQAPVWVVSDGHQGLLAAVDLQLPWAIQQRCTWHIAHRARHKVIHGDKDRFAREALWVFNAADAADAIGRLCRWADRWLDTEPEAVSSVAAKFEQGIEYLRHPQIPVRPRTVAISERYNQEPKRRFKALRAFGAEANMQAMTRLIALRHNCILDRTDWLAHALSHTWNRPLPATTPPQQKRHHPPPYTNGGT